MSRDESALPALFTRYQGPILRFFLRSGAARPEAEDLTQDVFLRALRVDHRRPILREAAWLFRIARNLWIDRLRRRGRRQAVASDESIDPNLERQGVGPNQALAAGLGQALAQLPDADREPFLLREVGGLSYDEIAAVTDSTAAAVRSRIFRARRALRQVLAPSPIRSTDPESPR